MRAWLEEESLLKKVVEDQHQFHFSINYPRGSPFSLSIVQPQARHDMVAIISATELIPQHFNQVKQMNMEKRGQLIQKLRLVLLSRPKIGFQLIFENPRELTLQRYLIVLELYEDGLNKTLFMHSLQEVHKAFLFSLEVINSHLGTSAELAPERMSESDKFFAEYL